MAKRILVDKNTKEIRQFQDTDKFNYADPPEWGELIEISNEEWERLKGVAFEENELGWINEKEVCYFHEGKILSKKEYDKIKKMMGNDQAYS